MRWTIGIRICGPRRDKWTLPCGTLITFARRHAAALVLTITSRIPVTATSHPEIRTVALAKTYGTPASPVHALRGVTISIGRAEKIALVGKSGSGKSTLLNLLGGLDRPTAGSIEIGGRDLARLTSNQLAHYRLNTV